MSPYVDVSVRSINSLATQPDGKLGLELELGRSGISLAVEAGRSVGDTPYTERAVTLGTEGYSWSPYVKAGTLTGEVEASLRAVGVEYRTTPYNGGWSTARSAATARRSARRQAGRAERWGR